MYNEFVKCRRIYILFMYIFWAYGKCLTKFDLSPTRQAFKLNMLWCISSFSCHLVLLCDLSTTTAKFHWMLDTNGVPLRILDLQIALPILWRVSVTEALFATNSTTDSLTRATDSNWHYSKMSFRYFILYFYLILKFFHFLMIFNENAY